MSVVLDASAILAIILNETGNDKVRAALNDATISTVNLSEIYATATEKGLDIAATRQGLAGLGLAIVAFGEAHAFLAGELRRQTRGYGLSLGDRACLATAMIEKRPVMTADRAWLQLALPVEVISIR